ncbi:MAG TPA: hypothetical protein DEQ47_16840 [Solibacterales bacterium]|nr:hypothetical protein [Bryobacterales bacterium]
MKHFAYFALILSAAPLWGQTDPKLDSILGRLDQMEQSNRQLLEEIRSLRAELEQYRKTRAPESPPVEERVAVQEQQTAELAQTKVEASQKMPVSLTGMLLFNAFHNGPHGGSSEDPVVAGTASSPRSAGASLRQTVLGLTFHGPDLPWGGKASGSLFMDFFAGSQQPDNHLLHVRVATLDLNWKNTTVTVGQDKPMISPREPDSLAQVGVSPLTAAGNLWDWQPQVRVEQRFAWGESAGFRAQAGVYQTSEQDSYVPGSYVRTLEALRPGYQGRLEYWHAWGSRRLELAPGFHLSTTHVAGTSVDSRVASIDWLVAPLSKIQFTGEWFQGQDVAVLGGLRQGFRILGPGHALPVHSAGGWSQLAFFATSRLTFHVYGGQQRDRASDLYTGSIRRNFVYAGNLIYRLAPNVLASVEASQTRTTYLNIGNRLNNHYDLALAYLF